MSDDWSAPVERWVRRATDRKGKVLSPAVRLLLDAFWSRADSPSKRDPGHAFVYGDPVTNEGMSIDLACEIRTIERQFRTLRDNGLVSRGEQWIDGQMRAGIWLADVPNAGRFGDSVTPTDRSLAPDRSVGVKYRSPDRIDGASPTELTVPDRQIDRVLIDKEDPNNYPNKDPTTAEFGSSAHFADEQRVCHALAERDCPGQQALLDLGPDAMREPVDELWDEHERLSVEAYAAHGLGKTRNGRVPGKLPKRSSASGRKLMARMRAGVREHGLELCLAVLRWRSEEWAGELDQLARPPQQVWAQGAVTFAIGRLDAGLRPRGRGNMSSTNGYAVSRSEAPPNEVYEMPFTNETTGEFDYDAAMAELFDDDYRERSGGGR